MRNAVRQVAMVWPASSAVVSKATPIFAASSANRRSSARGIDAWPADCTSVAISAEVIGKRIDSAWMSSPICLNCCGVSKLTTLRTPAMADSNCIASPTGAAAMVTARIPP